MIDRGAAPPDASSSGPLAAYAPDARRYDEALDCEGAVRAHWRPLLQHYSEAARGKTRRDLDLTQRLIRENGVTYNVYADPQGTDRPWALDPMPLLITPEEWRDIERGVAQRARLLNALLADLYGAQKTLTEGVAPSALAFGHPNFLWPCHGLTPRGGRWLHVYAADLARAPDGRWWLLADRTQAPSGAGYALENREILQQVLPDSIAELRVRRVHRIFQAFRAQLLNFAGGDEEPLAVILTPGPFNETYFEHAYLARQLGIALAEGHDLTVRDDTVYLKTLGGLRRVHAIYRRLDDDFCDPVELRYDSALGIPGLLGAVRADRVVLANALGSGVLESAAWLGFMPSLSERLLGESLKLPCVATWWCGEQPALEYVIANLDALVIKPTYPNQRFEPVFGVGLRGEQRDALIARLRARPYAYVAQEHVALSQAPAWRSDGSGLVGKPVAIRVYVINTPDGPQVLPGGLARIGGDSTHDVVSSQRGGGSKDVWVLSTDEISEPVEQQHSLARVSVRHNDVPSRLVENLYWFGRYSVRCEDKARLLHATLAARSDARLWRAAVKVCRDLDFIAPDAQPASSLRDDTHPHGLVADIHRLGWCASQMRSRLSLTHWRAVVDLQRRLEESASQGEETRETLARLLLSFAAFSGFAFDQMTRDESWRLLRVGRRLERLQLLATLHAHNLRSGTATRQAQVEWLLEVCDSSREYRTRYVVSPRLGPMLDLLLRDHEHPRALAFQQQAIAQDLAALAVALGGGGELRLENPLSSLSDGRLLQMEGDDEEARVARRELAQRLQTLAASTSDLSDRLSMRYFSHTGADAHALAT